MIIFGFGRDKEGYDRNGYDRDGYDRKGFDAYGRDRNGYDAQGRDKEGYDRNGYNQDGYDRNGYDSRGFNARGIYKNGGKFNAEGFDRNGYDIDGFDNTGFNVEGFNREGFDKNGYDRAGFDKNGFNKNGYNSNGYDRKGYDKEGFNKKGFDKDGFNRKGFDKAGYDRNGRDKNGFDMAGRDRRGYDQDGYDRRGYDRAGFNKLGYNRDGYSRSGYDKNGYDKDGYDRNGYDKHGYNRNGYDWNGYDVFGRDANGYNKEGYNKQGFDREGYDRSGYDRQGFDKSGYDANGFDSNGFDKKGFGRDGYNANGFNLKGIHRNGTRFDQDGYDIHGLDPDGLDANGFNAIGFLASEVKRHFPKIIDTEEISPLVEDALAACKEGEFQAALKLAESALNENPGDAKAYLAALMAEKHATQESQLSYVGAFDFSDIADNANYKNAIQFGPSNLRDRLSVYAYMNRQIVSNWIILDTDTAHNRQLILSRYCISAPDEVFKKEKELDFPKATTLIGNYITWEQSSSRKWLNGAYIDSLPNYIRNRLIKSEIHTQGTYTGYDFPDSWEIPSCTTQDKVFSLDTNEVLRFFPNEESRRAYHRSGFSYSWATRSSAISQYPRDRYILPNDWAGGDMFGNYVVMRQEDNSRMICDNNFFAYGYKTIENDGEIKATRYNLITPLRPAMWINIDSDKFFPHAKSWFPDITVFNLDDIKNGARKNIAFGGFPWRVLEVIDGAALLLSETILKIEPYDRYDNQGFGHDASAILKWSNAPIRKWLNDNFLNGLDEYAKKRVLTKKNITYESAFKGNSPSSCNEKSTRSVLNKCKQTTADRIFLLSEDEVIEYFPDEKSRVATFQGQPCPWVIRTFDSEPKSYPSRVSIDGAIDRPSRACWLGIRPALWVKL